MRKILLSILGIALIIIAIFFSKNIIDRKGSPKPSVEKVVQTVFTQTVKNGAIPIIINASGTLRAQKRLELYTEVQGVFLPGKTPFKTGQKYRLGETIIKINAAEYYASVQSAKSNLYNLITSVMPDLRLDYPEVYPKWQSYLSNFNINQSVPKLPKMTSEKEKFFISGRGILTNYYTVKNQEQRLSKYTLSAPYNGILIEALVTEGTLVRPGQKLGVFINTTVYELEIAIGKTYIDMLKIGAPVVLVNLEKKQTYTGKVSRINGSVDQNSQTVKAFIEVSHSTLKEGMYLEARLHATEEQHAISIDRNLLIENDKIFVVRDSVLDIIDVKPVYFSDKNVVLKQVPDGITIVSKPVIGAYAGMRVKVSESKRAPTPEK